jgi:hypothetical protein
MTSPKVRTNVPTQRVSHGVTPGFSASLGLVTAPTTPTNGSRR